MKIEGIDHVMVLVKDIEAAMKFFSKIMGTKYVGPIDHGAIKVAFDNAGLELMTAVATDSPWAAASKKLEDGQGLCSIAFKVPDLDEAIEELKKQEIKCILKIDDVPGIRVAELDPSATFGLWIELVEYDNIHPAVIPQLGKIKEIPFYES